MPIDISLGGTQDVQSNNVNESNNQSVLNVEEATSTANPETLPNVQNNSTYNLNEEVYIPSEAPIIILYGPTSCGKSMALKRIVRYLKNQSYQAIEPEKSFRPSYDIEYNQDCQNFDNFISSPTKASGTTGYMLVNVIESGTVICRILEAPGEYYFDPERPKKQYPIYMASIITSNVRRIWCIFVEPNWKNPNDRMNYVSRINKLKQNIQEEDEVLFVFNKIDETHFVNSPGNIMEKKAIDYINNQYPGIFNQFKNDIPIVKWFKKYNCGFIPFQTGMYQDDSDNYADSAEVYPEMLWKEIKKRL